MGNSISMNSDELCISIGTSSSILLHSLYTSSASTACRFVDLMFSSFFPVQKPNAASRQAVERSRPPQSQGGAPAVGAPLFVPSMKQTIQFDEFSYNSVC